MLLTAGKVNDATMFAPCLVACESPAAAPAARGPGATATDPAPTRPYCTAGVLHTPSPSRVTSRPIGAARFAGGRPVGFDAARYARRKVVERDFCQVEQ